MGRLTVSPRRRGFLALALRASTLAIAGSSVALVAAPVAAQEASSAAVAKGIAAWDIASSDLPADPSIRFGVLPNGMRYAIKHHETPKDGGAVRFTFDVGKLEEGDGELNAAHFIEHMAFNGSTNIPEGELVKRLERLGLSFGADTNAETDLEHTTYKLDLPRANDETIDAALTFMREIASELTIAPAAVDRERGILVSEYNQRNVPMLRRLLDNLRVGVPGTRFGPGLVGSPDTIRSITPAQLRAFYEGYYRPENATLVMVGDFDVDAVEKDIRERFSGWKAKGAAREGYTTTLAKAPLAFARFSDATVREIIQIDSVAGYPQPLNSVAGTRDDYLRAIANQALTNRFKTIARAEGSPIIDGAGLLQDVGRAVRTASTLVAAKDGQWEGALAVGEQQLRQARQFGFTGSEVEEVKAAILTNLTNAANQASGRQASAVADSISRASLADEVVVAPETALAMYQAVAPTIDAAAVSKAFASMWANGPTLVHVSTKQAIAGGDTAVSDIFEKSGKVAVAAPVEQATAAFAYNSFGAPGKVVSDKTIADLGIREIRFANGTQLNLKKTDFVPDQVAWKAEIGSGLQAMQGVTPGFDTAFAVMNPQDGLGKHDPDELRRVLAGRKVRTGLSVAEDAIVATGTTTSADLPLQLKLIAAQLTDTAWRPSSSAQWAALAPVVAKNIVGDPTQRFMTALPNILASGDNRAGLADPASLTAVSLDDAKAALAGQLAKGGIAIGVVGDFDEKAVIDAVAATLGALPGRMAPGKVDGPVVPMAFPTDLSPRMVFHDGAADQGFIGLAWKTDDADDLKMSLTRDMLAAVMQLRLTDVVREELGATYTPQAFSSDSLTFDGYGFIAAAAPAEPGSMDEVAAAFKKIAAELAASPPTADEMLRARKPVLDRWERQARENGAWTSVVAEAQTRPELLDRRRNRAAIMAAITPAEVQASARLYLDPAKAVEVRSLPRPTAN